MTAEQMKAAEDAAFCKGSTPAGLMEIAGEEIASVIHQYFPKPSTLVVFCGKGHNGGDALVVARHLEAQGWNILIRLTTSVDEMSPLAREHLESLEHSQCISSLPPIFGPLVILDGLLGIGAVGAPKGIIADQIIEMNHLRVKYGGFTVAVDIPSGLDATTGEVFTPCVQSDLTVTLGGVKSGLVADTATPVVGRIALVPLPDLFFSEGDPASLITPTQLRHLLPIAGLSWCCEAGLLGFSSCRCWSCHALCLARFLRDFSRRLYSRGHGAPDRSIQRRFYGETGCAGTRPRSWSSLS